MGVWNWSILGKRMLRWTSVALACGMLASPVSAQWAPARGFSAAGGNAPGQSASNQSNSIGTHSFANQGFPSLESYSDEAPPRGRVVAHQQPGTLPGPYFSNPPYTQIPGPAYGAAAGQPPLFPVGDGGGQYPMWATSPHQATGPVFCGPQNVCQPETLCPVENVCCEPPPVGCFYGGFEFLWMRAHFDQNVAMIVDPPVGNILVAFDYEFKLTPRTWLGWQGSDGGGFRATYWRFDSHAATERATAVPFAEPVYIFVYGAGGNLTRNAYGDTYETLVTNHNLTLQTLDLEATQQFGLGSLQCLAGGGVRVADMDQHMRADIYDASNSLWEVVTNDLSFRGVGPTASLQLWRPLGRTRLAGFGGMRGALLFSETRQSIYEMKDAYANEVQDIAESREILSMGEMSVGLQYTYNIGRRAQVFARGSYEAQAWFDVGGPVDSQSTVGLDGIGLATGLIY